MKYLQKNENAKWPIVLIILGFALVVGLLCWILWGSPGVPVDSPGQAQNGTGQTDQGESQGGTEQTEPGQTQSGTEPTEPSQGQSGTDKTEPTEPGGNSQSSQPTEPAATTEPTQPTQPTLKMPYSLENGKIVVESLFQFTGMNPDAQDEYVEDVAAIQLTNTSQKHLESAAITVTTADGVKVSFTAYDIPAGGTAMVVSADNVVIENNSKCLSISGRGVFLDQAPLAADKLEISVVGTEITVKNISGQDLSRITVCCHSMLDQSCFGGVVNKYEIDSLPAGETTVISALECYLGLLEVVRVEIGAK